MPLKKFLNISPFLKKRCYVSYTETVEAGTLDLIILHPFYPFTQQINHSTILHLQLNSSSFVPIGSDEMLFRVIPMVQISSWLVEGLKFLANVVAQ